MSWAGWPPAIYRRPVWCLYDDTSGQVRLVHPWKHSGQVVPCHYCGERLAFVNFRAECCGQVYQSSMGRVVQLAPYGLHTKTYNRGWSSLRPAGKGD